MCTAMIEPGVFTIEGLAFISGDRTKLKGRPVK
jgi:hypothetical protein